MTERIKRGFWWLFLKIEEPRIIRLLQFALYVVLTIIGSVYLSQAHTSYEGILGPVLAHTLGALIVFGGVLGALAVLPGIWWVERLAVISLWTGLAIYLVVALSVQISVLSVGITWALIIALAIRWLQIREFQFAPGR